MNGYSREAALRTLGIDPPDGPIDLGRVSIRLLVLGHLACRVGLDPTWGVTWTHDGGGAWEIETPVGARKFYRRGSIADTDSPWDTCGLGITTTDPEEALLRALWATRPEEAR